MAVKHFNQTKKQSLLKKSLKSENSTRWSSNYEMMYSVYDSFDEVSFHVSEEHRYSWVLFAQKPLLKELVDFLLPFKIATKRLEGVKVATIQCVIPTLRSLLNHCSESASSFPAVNSEMAHLKTLMHKVLTEKLPVNPYHVAASFLDPRMTSRVNKVVSPGEYIQGMDLIKGIVSNHLHRIRVDSSSAPNRNPSQSPPMKKSANGQTSIFAFDDNIDEDERKDNDVQDPCVLEMNCFLSVRLSTRDAQDESFDLLKWWRDNGRNYPLLAKVAQFVLAIPASSAESERVFSASSNTVTVKRSQLLPSNINGLLVIKFNVELIY